MATLNVPPMGNPLEQAAGRWEIPLAGWRPPPPLPDLADRRARWRQRAEAILAAGEKTCPGCGQTLCLAAFARSARYLDGRQPLCRRCKREYHLTAGQPRPQRPRAWPPQWPLGWGPAA